jgi:hypothetical protein
MAWPAGMAEMSTSVVESARTSADGFIWSIKGHSKVPVPTAKVDQASRSRKSRRVAPPAWVECPAGCSRVTFAIHKPLIKMNIAKHGAPAAGDNL